MTTYPLTTLAATITATGITAPAYSDIVASLQASYRAIYGSDAYLEADSQDGQWIAVQAQAIHDCNTTAIAVYNSFSPATAQGAGLSSVVKINGIARLVASNSTAPGLVVGQVGTTITGGVVEDVNGAKWDLPSTVVIPTGGQVTVTVTAQEKGAVVAAAGAINKISTPTRGWQSFISTAAATAGDPVESDAVLRQRQTVSVALPSKTVLEGLVGAVSNLPSVGACVAYENDTKVTNAIGIPGNSIAVVVEGGDVQAVAATIAGKKTPGTGTYGTTSVLVFDEMGMPSTIEFFERTTVDISVVVVVHPLTGFLSSTTDTLKATVAEYISGLGIGAGDKGGSGKVYHWKVGAKAALMGTGLENTFEVQSVALGRDGGVTAPADVTIAFNEQPICGVTAVTVEVA